MKSHSVEEVMSTSLTEPRTNLNFRTLDSNNTRVVAEALQNVLYDLIGFGLLVKQAHWNVIGSNFRSIHLQLDEIYADVTSFTDETAERITALGVSPNGQAKEVTAGSDVLPLDLGFIRDESVVLMVADRMQLLNHSIRGQMDTIEDKDTVSADVLHGIVGTLEKHHWMLKAQTE